MRFISRKSVWCEGVIPLPGVMFIIMGEEARLEEPNS